MNMKHARMGFVHLLCSGVLALAIWLWPGAASAAEKSFDELKIGSRVYKNVTVTTQNKDYVFLLHSAGMTNIKVAELSEEEKELLGYMVPKPKAAVAQEITRQALNRPEVKAVEKEIAQTLASPSLAPLRNVKVDATLLASVAAVVLLLYLFQCYCLMLICRKAGQPGGFLVWVPVLQGLPMLTAAGMSRWWFLAFFVPIMNVVVSILWCFKIVEARGKSMLVAVMLLLPVTNLIAFLYLAFSNGEHADKARSDGRIQIMTLKTA